MNFEHDEIERMLAESAARYALETGGIEAARAAAALPEGYDRQSWLQFAEMGWIGAALDEAAGGFDLGAVGPMIIAEALAKGLNTAPFLPTAGFAAPLLADCGSTLLQDLIAGKALAVLALHEAGLGYDIMAANSMSIKTADGWRLNGSKSVVLAGDSASHFIVSAQEGEDLSLFLVDSEAEGVSRDAVRLGDNRGAAHVRFVDVDLPAEARLDVERTAHDLLNPAYHVALITAASENIGAAQAAFDATLDYVKTREQFGKPIGKFQVLQHRLVDASIKLEEARSLIMAAAMALRENNPERDALATAAWVQTCWSTRAVAEESVQIHGGIGMTDELEIGDYLKRITVNEMLFGIPSYHLERYTKLVA